MMLWLVLIGTLSLVLGRPQSPRRYITINAGSTTYYGTMASVQTHRNVEVPKLYNLKYDAIVDIALYDQITIEENGLYEVYNERDGPALFKPGDKVLMWVYNPNTRQFSNVLSVVFADDADFRVFKRILQQYVNG